jgi:histidinol dehydrogenase
MTLRVLDSSSAAFRRFLAAILARPAGSGAIDRMVAGIIAQVQRRGDRALVDLTEKFDGVRLTPSRLRVTPREMNEAAMALKPADRAALRLAARRISAYHCRTHERSFAYRDSTGMRLGLRVRPLTRVGIYVPGGQGAYPSSVLMNALAARSAGVGQVVMVSPPSRNGDNSSVLAAAAIAGVDEFYRVGGAQAVAALAYGTRTIKPVDKIVGPGNAWVQAAKRMVYGVVDIDKIAGPSEVTIIADAHAQPDWVAADLIAQAEHGSGDESALLFTPSRKLVAAVIKALDSALADLPRAAAIRRVLGGSRSGAVIVSGLDEAFRLANLIAPEHLELELSDAQRWLDRVESAGAVFVGAYSPAPLGDYLAGPNHVLPTGGAARFASPLGPYDFIKRTSIIESSPAALDRLGPAVMRLARLEGFEGHARAVEIRLDDALGKRNGSRKKRKKGARTRA